MKEGPKYFGKYRGTVLNNNDPMQLGRLQVQVPDVTGLVPGTWAEPCVPLAGPSGPPMGVYLVPLIGTQVWVEFEQGNPDHPIWTGCRWGKATNIPMAAKASALPGLSIVLQTVGQHMVAISDLPSTPATGGITLKSTTGATITVNDSGIYITNGKGASIVLTGPTVTINNGALTIT